MQDDEAREKSDGIHKILINERHLNALRKDADNYKRKYDELQAEYLKMMSNHQK